MTVGSFVKGLSKTVSHNSPTILTGVAVAGIVTTAVMSVKATFKAAERIQDGYANEDPTFRDKFELVWPLYIPAAGVGIATIAAVVGANSISTRRNAALISLYTLSETAFKEYQEKNLEQNGRNSDQSVRDAVARDRVDSTPEPGGREVIIIGSGEVLCFDSFTSRYFNSSMEELRKAQNDINLQCINDGYASLNEFYQKIGLPEATIGEEVGFTTDTSCELVFSSVISEDGKPCIAFVFRDLPKTNFYKIW